MEKGPRQAATCGIIFSRPLASRLFGPTLHSSYTIPRLLIRVPVGGAACVSMTSESRCLAVEACGINLSSEVSRHMAPNRSRA